MEMNLGFCIFFISFTKFLLPTLSSTNSTDRIRWCNKTPYPRLGLYHLRQQYHNSATMNRHEFRNLAVEVAMNQALNALSHMKWLEPKCYNKQEKAAWNDCLELYESTILQLNQTLDDTNKHTDDDVQTWLSAALTNLDTCRTGFIELGVTKNILPLISNNVSERISNILAINAPFVEQRTYINEFPSSLLTWDRRISQLGETKRSKPDVVVAKDGSGNFSTVKEALLHIFPKRRERKRLVIYVKNGVYDEHVEVSNGMKNVMMIGDGINKTIVTGNHSNRQGFTTLGSATFVVLGKGFIACGITFRNTAGPENGQAVALVSRSDLSVFYQCSFDGYQDTLYVHSNRQFYKECHIYGTVDFIFGNAAVVFQNCVVYSRARKHGENVVTAQGRTDPNEKTGISIHNSRVVTSRKTFLGRPWQEYSRTVYLQTYLDALVDPVGWLEWKSDVKNLYYGEYKNNGPGSSTKRRVKWGGYRVMKDRAEAENFTVANFIGGESWLPNTGVPFTSKL